MNKDKVIYLRFSSNTDFEFKVSIASCLSTKFLKWTIAHRVSESGTTIDYVLKIFGMAELVDALSLFFGVPSE